MSDEVQYTLLESESHYPITKQITLLPDGSIRKESLAHNLTPGWAKRQQATMPQFAERLEGLKPHQALTFGTLKEDDFARVITKKDQDRGQQLPGDITRTNENFVYPDGPGIFLGDADNPLLPVDALVTLLGEMDPVLSQAPMVYRPSAGSCLYDPDTNAEIVGVKGYRLYIGVDNASRIPELGRLLQDHCWLHGQGYFEISKSGSYLERGPLDTAVWQPSRIDFAGGAMCEAPLEQRLPPPRVINPDAPLLNVAACIERLQRTPQQRDQLNKIKQQARLALEPEATKVRERWMQDRIQKLTTRSTGALTPDVAEAVLRQAVEKQELGGDFELLLQSGEVATVDQLLADPTRYHGQRCADPLETDYDTGRRVAYIALERGRPPTIWSHAHGGIRYSLVSTTRPSIILQQGETYLAVDATIDILRKDPLIFDRDHQMVRVNTTDQSQPHIEPFDKDGLQDYLGRRLQYQRYDNNAKLKNVDPPEMVCRQIIARGRGRQLNQLRAISTAPTLSLDGAVLDQPGYDPITQLLFTLPHGTHHSIPFAPDQEQVCAAVRYAFTPFKDFPFADNLSRSVFFACMLTAPLRIILPTAPGFATNAPIAGSGKTLLKKCISVLTDGRSPQILAHVISDEEMRKRILALLMQGSRVILIDNVVGRFASPTLEALLTTPVYTDRILGVSKVSSLPMTAMVLITGNHLNIVGDLNRRILVSSLNPGIEKPYLRQFDLDPLDYVLQHRQDLVRALLLIVRGYLSSGAGRIAEGDMASFEHWDRLVRQTICWLSTLPGCPLELTDPAQAVAAGYENDAATEALRRVLPAWIACYGNTPITTKQILLDLNQPCLDPIQRSAQDRLFEALTDAVYPNKSNAAFTAKDLGAWLDHNFDRPLDDRILLKEKTKRDGYTQWRVTGPAPMPEVDPVDPVDPFSISGLDAPLPPMDLYDPRAWAPPPTGSTAPTEPENPFAALIASESAKNRL